VELALLVLAGLAFAALPVPRRRPLVFASAALILCAVGYATVGAVGMDATLQSVFLWLYAVVALVGFILFRSSRLSEGPDGKRPPNDASPPDD
jgi:hypothetical protein